MTTTSFQCRCGAMRGSLERAHGSRFGHVVCDCDDCRAFLRWLGRDDLLDAGGGTEITAVGDLTSERQRLRGLDGGAAR